MKDLDIHSWLEAGLKDIEQGKAPWSVDKGPIQLNVEAVAIKKIRVPAIAPVIMPMETRLIKSAFPRSSSEL